MKPVVIISIAVVCSVIAVFGVLLIDDLLTQMELDHYQKFTNKIQKVYNNYKLEILDCAKHTPQYGESCAIQVLQYFGNTVDGITENYGYEIGIVDDWIYSSQKSLFYEYELEQNYGDSYSRGTSLDDNAE